MKRLISVLLALVMVFAAALERAGVTEYDLSAKEVSDKVNDTYLKLNDQQDGVRSYGKMVDLLLAYRRSL